MGNAQALFFVHGDEDYPHVHIVASKLNPQTGFAYDQKILQVMQKAQFAKLFDFGFG